jgi:glycosyltransferase involved in cell wall biosynthesis
MPLLNGGAFLQPAIDSVLAQRGPSFELLIVDDGSVDGGPERAERLADPRIHVIRNARRTGLAAALNVGLARARGEFVARLDADDVARPARLEQQVGFLRSHPQVALVGSQARLIDETGAVIGTVERSREDASIRWYSMWDNPFIHSSVMFRRAEVAALGGYDESLRLCEDWELWGRIMTRHGGCNLDEALIDYRFSLASTTGAIESSTTHPRRPLFEEITRRLVARHADLILGADTVSPEDAKLMSGFSLGVNAAMLDAFLAGFVRLLDAFMRRHRQTARTVDFHRTVARQFDAIAYRVTPARRRHALRVYLAALGRGPAVARHVSWPRAIILALFGRSGRDRLRLVRNASRTAKTA